MLIFAQKILEVANTILLRHQSRIQPTKIRFLFHKPRVFKNFKNESPKVGSPSPLFPTILALPIIPEADAPRLYIQSDSISSLPSTSDFEKK